MSRIDFKGRTRWLLAELVVVVLGVLIALWVDGLQQARTDRRTEQVVLGTLLEELREDERQFEYTLAFFDRRRQAQEELLRIAAGAVSVAPDSVDTLWSWALFAGVADFSDAALTSAIASGSLSLIRDDSLRVFISAWPSSRRAFLAWEEDYLEILSSDLLPLLRSAYSLPSSLGGDVTTDATLPNGAALPNDTIFPTEFALPGYTDPEALREALSDRRVIQDLRHLASFWPVYEQIFARSRREFLSRLEARIADNLDPS